MHSYAPKELNFWTLSLQNNEFLSGILILKVCKSKDTLIEWENKSWELPCLGLLSTLKLLLVWKLSTFIQVFIESKISAALT